MGACHLAKEIQKFWLEINWFGKFPENLFGNCGCPLFPVGMENRKWPYHMYIDPAYSLLMTTAGSYLLTAKMNCKW